MDRPLDTGSPRLGPTLKPNMRVRKTYLNCVMVRQLDGTVKVWGPVKMPGNRVRWELLKVSSSMKSAHNFVHNTRAKKA